MENQKVEEILTTLEDGSVLVKMTDFIVVSLTEKIMDDVIDDIDTDDIESFKMGISHNEVELDEIEFNSDKMREKVKYAIQEFLFQLQESHNENN